MNVILCAYHNTGYAVIKELLKRKNCTIQKVYTHIDSAPEGVWFRSVAKLCKAKGIRVALEYTMSDLTREIKSLAPDVVFTVGFRSILPKGVMAVPRYGCVNLHGALLPKYRGRCPLNWAIINGEKECGVTAHVIDPKGVDAGDIIVQKKITILKKDTIGSVSKKIYALYPSIVGAVIRMIEKEQTVFATPQDESHATCFPRRTPEDGRINWDQSPECIYNFVRALTKPYPGAFSFRESKKVLVWRVVERKTKKPHKKNIVPGTVMQVRSDGIVVAVRQGEVRMVEFSPVRTKFRIGELLR